jgi:hypothetical protein
MASATAVGVREPPDASAPRPAAVAAASRAAAVRRALPVLAVVGPVLLFVAHAVRYGRWLVDDALISFAYARTLSLGGGLAQRLGEAPVEGASNPTWTLLLAGLRRLGLFDRGGSVLGVDDYVVVVKVLAVLCFTLLLLLVFRTSRALLGPGPEAFVATSVAGCLLALSPNVVIWFVSGLENPLYGVLALALATLLTTAAVRSTLLRPRTAILAAGLVLLLAATRPDGMIFVAAYPLVLLVRTFAARPGPSVGAVLVHGVAFGVPAGVLLLWRHAAFGLWIPNTAVAKAQHFDPGTVPARLHDLVTAAGWPSVLAAVLALTGALLLPRLVRPAAERRSFPLAGLAVPFGLACAAFVVLNRDWMGEYRFATPAAVLGAALLGVAFARCVQVSRSRRWRWLLAGLALLLVVAELIGTAPRTAAFAARPTVPGCFVADRYGRQADFYADRLGIAGGSYLVPDIGGVLLTSRLQVVDLAGLTEPTIARFRGARDDAGLRDYVLETVRPTFVHLHSPWGARLASDRRFRADYLAIVPGADYVRRDATSPDAVRRLRPLAQLRARAENQARVADPRRSCGPLLVR